jgi:hypothetical protein
LRAPAKAATRLASATSASITVRSPSSFKPVEASALRSHERTSASSTILVGQPFSIGR